MEFTHRHLEVELKMYLFKNNLGRVLVDGVHQQLPLGQRFDRNRVHAPRISQNSG